MLYFWNDNKENYNTKHRWTYIKTFPTEYLELLELSGTEKFRILYTSSKSLETRNILLRCDAMQHSEILFSDHYYFYFYFRLK